MLNPASHHRLTEYAHQVVGQHGKAQGSFRGPEVVQIEGIEAKIRLQFLDPVLAVGSLMENLGLYSQNISPAGQAPRRRPKGELHYSPLETPMLMCPPQAAGYPCSMPD
jgi:hypothetical protein